MLIALVLSAVIYHEKELLTESLEQKLFDAPWVLLLEFFKLSPLSYLRQQRAFERNLVLFLLADLAIDL